MYIGALTATNSLQLLGSQKKCDLSNWTLTLKSL